MSKSQKELEAGHFDSPSSEIGEVHDIPTQTHDAVFGEITEGGPNYRNVSTLLFPWLSLGSRLRILDTNKQPGRLAWNCRSHDEDSNRSRCPVHSSSL